ncbi:hypothetical protein EMIT0210MI2_250048 [Priestia megaterium]
MPIIFIMLTNSAYCIQFKKTKLLGLSVVLSQLVVVTISVESIPWIATTNPSAFLNPTTARRTRMVIRLLIVLRLLLSVKRIILVKML